MHTVFELWLCAKASGHCAVHSKISIEPFKMSEANLTKVQPAEIDQ